MMCGESFLALVAPVRSCLLRGRRALRVHVGTVFEQMFVSHELRRTLITFDD
jgi:hypothetical protein